jgi:hypothetical protein
LRRPGETVVLPLTSLLAPATAAPGRVDLFFFVAMFASS